MEDFDKFYGHLVYFKAIGIILWTFGIFYGYLVYFSRFGMLHQEKSGNHGWFLKDTRWCGLAAVHF
jgi:hypothetical protein